MKTKKQEKHTSVSSGKTSQPSELPSHASKELLLDADNLIARIGADTILQDISLCIHQGEFIGLIGPNGAGKTTLLRVLLGLQKPTQGTVNTSKHTLSYVPQRGNVYSGIIPLSVLEVVRLGANGSLNVAEEALQQVEMLTLAHKPFTELSGGQQQRVVIAKALASNPSILFLDEPTTGIDEASQHEFYTILQKLQQQGLTVVIVSHDIDAVLNLVTRVICLNKTILYDGSPDSFEAEKYLPQSFKTRHRILHHHHGGQHA